jgi:hypothetical protein
MKGREKRLARSLYGATPQKNVSIKGVGLGRVVRKVRQHPEDHEFESQRWQ